MSNYECPHCGMTNIDCGWGKFRTPKEIELESRVKELEEKLNAQFAEMEEKLTAEENKNFELKEKLKIAEEALTQISKTTLVMKHNGYTYRFEDFFGKKEAQQALKQMEEVNANI